MSQSTQNITLSLPKETLRAVKHIAVSRDTSVSKLLTDMLEDLVAHETGYAQARREFEALLEEGFDLGTGGSIKVSRDELHER